jgi:hypothetical protein
MSELLTLIGQGPTTAVNTFWAFARLVVEIE